MKNKEIKIKEYKKILVEILGYLEKICNENNIEYTLTGGSLIGAVRHKGIIPWDDDIDVMMSRENFNKFIKIVEDKKSNYSILTWKNNNTFYYPYAKLVDNRTYIKERETLPIDNYGIFVDIFPYDELPKKHNKLYFRRKQILRYIIMGYSTDYKKNMGFNGFLKNIIIFMCKHLLNRNKVFAKYDKLCTKYNNSINASDLVMVNWFTYGFKREQFKKEWLVKFKYTDFEDIKVKIIKDYDYVLTQLYGDYMTPVKPANNANHGINAYWR